MADSTDLDTLEKELGDRVLAEVKKQLDKGWDELKPDVVDGLKECAQVIAKLTIRQLKGEDVSALKQHVHAQMANLLVIGQDIAVKNFWIAVYKTVGIAGEVLAVFAKGALKGALGV